VLSKFFFSASGGFAPWPPCTRRGLGPDPVTGSRSPCRPPLFRRNSRHWSIGPICGSVITVALLLRLGQGWVRVEDCYIQTAWPSDKMRISHVIKTGQWHSDPRIHYYCSFVVHSYCVSTKNNLWCKCVNIIFRLFSDLM